MVTIKKGGIQSNDKLQANDEMVKSVMRMNRMKFEEEVEKIKEQGATVGKIYALKELIHGKRKKEIQLPAAVQDSKTGKNEI